MVVFILEAAQIAESILTSEEQSSEPETHKDMEIKSTGDQSEMISSIKMTMSSPAACNFLEEETTSENIVSEKVQESEE